MKTDVQGSNLKFATFYLRGLSYLSKSECQQLRIGGWLYSLD